jgi:hypothetical protein
MLWKYFLHTLFLWWRSIYGFFQRIGWLIDGTAGRLQTIWNGQSYELSAHVMNISRRFKPCSAWRNSVEDYIATHVGFVHPDVVRKRTVSLYAVTPTEAVFVEVPDDVDLYNSVETPLFYVRQHETAVRIIRMPISSFHRIADVIGDPDDKIVVFLHYAARSGSTLMLQILGRVHANQKSICISEASPDSQLISTMGKYSDEELRNMFKSTCRLLCKDPASLVIMKMSNPDSVTLAPMFRDIFPRFYQLFSYRNALPMNRSKLMTYSQIYQFNLMYLAQSSPFLARLLCLPREKILRSYYGDRVYGRLKTAFIATFTMYQTICIHTAIQFEAYQTHFNNGVEIRGVRYEDIKTDPRAAIGRIMDHIGLTQYKDQVWGRHCSSVERANFPTRGYFATCG